MKLLSGMNALRIGFVVMIIGVAAIIFLAPSLKQDSGKEKAENYTIKVEMGFDGEFPARYTCEGQNISPPVNFYGVPDKAERTALIMEDPDAPVKVFTHWVIWNIPADENLTADVPTRENLENGMAQGTNDFDRTGYGGPCPPSGTHTYRLTAYALDTRLALEPGATKSELKAAMEGHVLASDTVRHDYG
ncbi:MAG: YbhB/YbcL family Raf kinase inhibitor-like protein [Candidatus Nanosalina sp.]